MITAKHLALLLAPAALAATAWPSVAAGPGVKPGYWETTSVVTSPIHKTDSERRCVTHEQVRKFMSCYINHHYDCTCGVDEVAGGRVRFEGQCVEKKSGSKVQIAAQGTYTDTTMSVNADATFHLLGIPVTGRATLEAHRIADACPADARS